MPTTDMLNDLILQLLADRNTTGTKPPRLLLAEARNLPQTCAEVVDRRSGSYRVQPQPGFTDAFEVYCDQEYEGGGWLVIQNRYNGSVNFFRGWKEYEAGFGDLRGEFWLGLEKLHELTYVKPHELRIVLEDFDGTIVTAQYDRFIVGGAAENYVLSSLGNYSGNAGDSLTSDHLGMQFSTFDSDNDKSDENCANLRKAGWWYNSCADSNLNGLYLEGPQPEENYGIAMCWYKFRGAKYGLKRSRMMIRVVNDI
ncbi:angiopoietin-related protein 7-like [Sabethes cyaneus]|uniref:angiopoietin-related protein 7-like n=1 Tax=Sabethes cyaneus TaxID=53552 RepID=UPI00237DC494|nr:angiopoietin-related protein 7-like [Sabethes cyaneus]